MTALLQYFDLWLPNIGQVNFSHDPLTKRVFQTLGYFLGMPLSFHRFQRKCETDGGHDPVRLREKLSGGFSSEFSKNKTVDYKPNKKTPLGVNSFLIFHMVKSDGTHR